MLKTFGSDRARGADPNSRRLAYSLAAGAAAASVGPGFADAAVLYSGVQDISISQRNSQTIDFDSVSYDYPYDDDLQLKNYVFGGVNYQGAFVMNAPGRVIGFKDPTSNLNYASALGAGVLVDEASVNPFQVSLAFGTNNPHAEFNDVLNAYIGLAFPIGGFNHFGWVRVSINNAAGTFVVHDWAYESERGVPIRTGQLPLVGDYNSDNVVDAADYTVWRDTLGSTADLRANGDGAGASQGVIDQGDYLVWKNAFGTTVGEGQAASTAVPEPVTLGLLAAGALGLATLRRIRG
jgi:hypothetical protein